MVLTNASHMEAKLAAKYSERIETLNETVAAHLVPTRLHLALVEIVDLLWLVLLIIALGVTRARQEVRSLSSPSSLSDFRTGLPHRSGNCSNSHHHAQVRPSACIARLRC